MMVQIEENKLQKIEVLLAQSMRGIHVLFENETIAQILRIPTEEIDFFSFDNMDRIQSLFTGLINKTTFEEKRCFLESLDGDSYETLVRAYFHIVDNTVLAATLEKH